MNTSTDSVDDSCPPAVPSRSSKPIAPPPSVFRRNEQDRYHDHNLARSNSIDSSKMGMGMGGHHALSMTGRHAHHPPHHVMAPTMESLRHHDLNQALLPPEALNKLEMDDLRQRCSQMEKTMKWWSDCTANWREKWSKVRAERNRYKEEVKSLSIRLDSIGEELSILRNEHDRCSELSHSSQNHRLSSGNELLDKSCQTEEGSNGVQKEDLAATGINVLNCQNSDSIDSGLNPSLDESMLSHDDRINRFLNDAVSSLAGMDRSNLTKLKLDEAMKNLESERNDKKALQSEIESLRYELSNLECQFDELRLSKQDGSRELQAAKNMAEEKVRVLELRLEEQLSKRNKSDQLIANLREEIERLQSENAEEWGKRERLETEVQSLERENRRLKAVSEEQKERVRKITSQANEQTSGELIRLQNQLESSSRELLDLRHQHNKLRKSHSETLEESGHLKRRCQTAESEVKKLRTRVEELKKELAKAEDENDQNTNCIRRLQRTSEELIGQVEGYQVQIEHLNSRLRALPGGSGDLSTQLRRSSRLSSWLTSSRSFQNPETFEDSSSSSEDSLTNFNDDDDNTSHDIETDV